MFFPGNIPKSLQTKIDLFQLFIKVIVSPKYRYISFPNNKLF